MISNESFIGFHIDIINQNTDLLTGKLVVIEHLGIEEKENEIVVYFKNSDEENIKILENFLKGESINYTTTHLENQNWNAVWESNYEPLQIENYMYIKADFHPQNRDCKYTIHITPKMSFGTGHHATTHQVIKMMRHLDFSGKNVLDFGTGTGILAIHAEQLGAISITAIDNDEWAFENSKENFEKNRCKNIVSLLGGLEILNNPKYDIILANINLHILLQYMNQIASLLRENGQVIFSGILKDDIDMMRHSITSNNLVIKDVTEMNNWLSILAQKIS